MKTLLVTNDFPPKVGGIQSYLFGLVGSLDAAGVRVLAPAHPEAEKFDAKQPYEISRVPTPRLYPTPQLLQRICKMSAGMDVVQFGYALQSWVLAPSMQRRTRVPYVLFAHGAEVLFPLRIPGATSLLMWGSLRRAAAVLTVSAHTAAGVERFTGGRVGCTVLRPIVDPEKFRSSDKDRDRVRNRLGLGKHPTVLCVSRLTARKGQDRLIDVLPALRTQFGAKLLLVGEGPLARNLRRRARRRRVEKDVIFAGRVPEELLPAYYATADVFAMPVRSRWFGIEEEGFGVVFAEAAAAGLPMLVGCSGGTSEAVEDGVTGYLVDGNSVPKIRQALARLLADEELREKMGRAAWKRVVDSHGAGVVGERYREVLESAAGTEMLP